MYATNKTKHSKWAVSFVNKYTRRTIIEKLNDESINEMNNVRDKIEWYFSTTKDIF
jgi:hypothetical protein